MNTRIETKTYTDKDGNEKSYEVLYITLDITINGGIRTLDECRAQLACVDGVMLGREAYYNPRMLARVDPLLFGLHAPAPGRHDVVRAMMEYAARECAGGTPLAAITRHILALFQSQPGARAWRRTLSEEAHRPGAGPELLWRALEAMEAAAPAAAA